MVSALCAWHEHHAAAVDEISRRLEQRQPLIVAAPALIEAYAVLTRLPPPHRLGPDDALALLEANFLEPAKVLTLDGRAYRALLRSAPGQSIVGGRVYDAVIVECAIKGGATALLTFNERDFAPVAPPGLEIVVPARGGVG
jgi:predicted nucleic acid-binding protein